MPSEIEVALLSPNMLWRDGLAHLLSKHSIAVASVASDPEHLSFTRPSSDMLRQILLIDARLPAYPGLYRVLRQTHEGAYITVLSDVFDGDVIVEALRQGVRGYLLLQTSMEILIASLKLIGLGEKIIPAEMVTYSAQHERPVPTAPQALLKNLSENEACVLGHLVNGTDNRTIGGRMGLSEQTVKAHVKTIIRKLGVSNRTQAAICAMQHYRGAQQGLPGWKNGNDVLRLDGSDHPAIMHYGNAPLAVSLTVHEDQKPYEASQGDFFRAAS